MVVFPAPDGAENMMSLPLFMFKVVRNTLYVLGDNS